MKSDWWKELYNEDEIENLECSTKLIILFSIIEECQLMKDKLVVFSQSLATLDLIEKFLSKDQWKKDEDYFRLDGSIKVEKRKEICDRFNSDLRREARYTVHFSELYLNMLIFYVKCF